MFNFVYTYFRGHQFVKKNAEEVLEYCDFTLGNIDSLIDRYETRCDFCLLFFIRKNNSELLHRICGKVRLLHSFCGRIEEIEELPRKKEIEGEILLN